MPDSIIVVSCKQPHNNEVVATFDEPARALSGSTAVDELAKDRCAREFRKYVGTDFENSRFDGLIWFSPAESDWRAEDRRFVCGAFMTIKTTGTAWDRAMSALSRPIGRSAPRDIARVPRMFRPTRWYGGNEMAGVLTVVVVAAIWVALTYSLLRTGMSATASLLLAILLPFIAVVVLLIRLIRGKWQPAPWSSG